MLLEVADEVLRAKHRLMGVLAFDVRKRHASIIGLGY
jgi:hypothetical protein